MTRGGGSAFGQLGGAGAAGHAGAPLDANAVFQELSALLTKANPAAVPKLAAHVRKAMQDPRGSQAGLSDLLAKTKAKYAGALASPQQPQASAFGSPAATAAVGAGGFGGAAAFGGGGASGSSPYRTSPFKVKPFLAAPAAAAPLGLAEGGGKAEASTGGAEGAKPANLFGGLTGLTALGDETKGDAGGKAKANAFGSFAGLAAGGDKGGGEAKANAFGSFAGLAASGDKGGGEAKANAFVSFAGLAAGGDKVKAGAGGEAKTGPTPLSPLKAAFAFPDKDPFVTAAQTAEEGGEANEGKEPAAAAAAAAPPLGAGLAKGLVAGSTPNLAGLANAQPKADAGAASFGSFGNSGGGGEGGAAPLTLARAAPSHRDRVVAIYTEFDPSKLGKVDWFLEKYKGQEAVLYRMVVTSNCQ